MKARLLDWLTENGVEILTATTCNEIRDDAVVVQNQAAVKRTLPADSVIVALPPEADRALADALTDIVPEVYRAGDCVDSRLILQAIADGARVGHRI